MIEAIDLTVRFGDRTALEGVSTTISPGEFVLLVGRNGAGKTTLLDQLSGLDQPTAGTVRVDGRDIHDHPTSRATVGRVFEEPGDQILNATVAADVAFGPENRGLPREEINARVDEALAAVGLSERSDAPVDALSGGQRARVAIAGALAMQPAYLLLDEPTAGLDHPGRQAVLSHLAAVNERGAAVVLATHDVRDLHAVADRVLGVTDGAIACDAPPEAAAKSLEDLAVRVPQGWAAG